MKTEWKIFWLFLIIIALITKPYPYGENEASRFNAIATIVEDHSLGWTAAYFLTDDRIRVNGKDYSDKPYALVLLSTPFYFILDYLDIGFSTYLGWSTYLLKLLIVGVSTGFLLVIFYRSLFLQEKYKIMLTLILGFCTLLFTYATAFNSHNISALLLFAAFLLHIKREEDDGGEHNQRTRFFCLGALLGLVAALDLVIGTFFTVGFSVTIFSWQRRHIQTRENFSLVFFLLSYYT